MYICKEAIHGIGVAKMRTIGIGIQSALSKKVVFGGKT